MDGLRDDPIALLLPEESQERRDRARRLATALRIFASDARDSGSPSVHVQLGHARDELAAHRREQVQVWFRAVLLHLADRCRPSTSFATLPAHDADYTTCWGTLLGWMEGESDTHGLAIPLPGPTPIAAFETVVESFARWAERVGLDSAQLDAALWRARRAWYAGETTAARGGLEDLLGRLARPRGARARALRAEALTDLIGLQLDRGVVAETEDTIARAGPVAERPADCASPLHALILVARWLAGDDGFPCLGAAFERVATAVPGPWRELAALVGSRAEAKHDSPRSRTPDGEAVRGITAGRIAQRIAGPESLDRRSFGAQALVVLEVDDHGRTRVAHADVAPALRGTVDHWHGPRRDAIGSRGTIENDAVRTGRAAVLVRCAERERDGERLDRSCLDAERGRPLALAVIPVLRNDDVVGLVWLECAHRLVPCSARRAALALAAAETIRPEHDTHPAVRLDRVGEEVDGPRARAARDDLRTTWHEVVRGLGLKTAERRWVAFDRVDADGRLVPVASGGDGEARLGAPAARGTWAVRRALRTGGFVRYGTEPADDRPSMLHPHAASGAALAIGEAPGVHAVLVVESARRGDTRERDVARWFEHLQARAPIVECASLNARDRIEHDGGFVVDGDAPDERERLARLRAIARRGADVLVVGEAGSGRRTVARRVFRGRTCLHGGGGLVRLASFGLDAERLAAAFDREGAAAVLLADVEWLAPPAQAELARRLAVPMDRRPRLLATAGVVESAERGGRPRLHAATRPESSLHPDLVRHLERLTARTVALREARHRVPALARFLVRRSLAVELVATAPDGDRIEDDAIALLWRQPWRGNVPELEATLQAALVRANGGSIDLPAIERAFDDAGLAIEPRLPSREPSMRDVCAAVWSTRTATHRMNKTRAALYLGWDPNTLAARLRDLGIASLEDAERGLGSG